MFQAVAIYNESGRFQQAGKMLKEVGEIHETNRNFPDAVDALQQAAEFLQVNKPIMYYVASSYKLSVVGSWW